MSLRSRLIVAFLLLSVLPLTAVTVLSYSSSVRAFERAAQREATDRAADVSRRMDFVTADLGRRMDRIFVAQDKSPEAVAPMLGDSAALVEHVEFHPAAAPLPPLPPRAAAGARRAPPPPPPGVVVMDMSKVMAEARAAARESMAGSDPKIGAFIEQAVALGMAGAGVGLKAAGDALAANVSGIPRIEVDGRKLAVAVRRGGKVVGTANATLNLDRTLQAVLAFSQREQGEVPFAVDKSGKLHTPRPPDVERLKALGVAALAPAAADGTPRRSGEWIIVAKRDASGIIFGIARPIGEPLREIRRTSVRNLGLGLGIIGLAVIGIVPISRRMTQHLTSLTAGVRQLAGGDFRTRVDVRSKDEFGALAASFNQMAADLERHQALIVEQERLHRELELSRQIQTEMLPRGPLLSAAAEIAGVSLPAREVGGDFFNYFDLPDGRLCLLVGDVSGKGVSAALLMANAQATLRARLPLENDLARLADAFDRELDRNTPRSVYLTLFIGILDDGGRTLRYVNAGHNPQFLIRASGGIEPLSSTGLPIALYSGHGYKEGRVAVEPGDLLFFYTDGLVEAENAAGDMFGAERLQRLLAEAQARRIDDILQLVDGRVRAFRGDTEPLDDATMMAMRVGVSGSASGPRPA